MPEKAPQFTELPDWTVKYSYVHRSKLLTFRRMKREIKKNALVAVVMGVVGAIATVAVGASYLKAGSIAVAVIIISYFALYAIHFVNFYVRLPREDNKRLRAIIRAKAESHNQNRKRLKTELTAALEAALVKLHPLQISSGNKEPYVSDFIHDGERFRVFRAQIRTPLINPRRSLNLKIKVMACNEHPNPMPEIESHSVPWFQNPLAEQTVPGNLFVDVVAQSLDESRKIIFCLPFNTFDQERKITGLWCELIAENRSDQPTMIGKMNFWLSVNDDGILQMQGY